MTKLNSSECQNISNLRQSSCAKCYYSPGVYTLTALFTTFTPLLLVCLGLHTLGQAAELRCHLNRYLHVQPSVSGTHRKFEEHKQACRHLSQYNWVCRSMPSYPNRDLCRQQVASFHESIFLLQNNHICSRWPQSRSLVILFTAKSDFNFHN